MWNFKYIDILQAITNETQSNKHKAIVVTQICSDLNEACPMFFHMLICALSNDWSPQRNNTPRLGVLKLEIFQTFPEESSGCQFVSQHLGKCSYSTLFNSSLQHTTNTHPPTKSFRNSLSHTEIHHSSFSKS